MITQRFTKYSRYFETDYARFDRTLSRPILTGMQNYIFFYIFPPPLHPLFHSLIEASVQIKGTSDCGIKYSTESRGSGDPFTSIGNGLINSENTFACLADIDGWDALHEGDDGFIGVDEEHADDVEAALDELVIFGFTIKISKHNQIDDASFCGRHFYTAGAEVLDHADILRSLDKFHTSVSNCKSQSLLLAKAMSYYHTDSNTPLIGILCYSLISVLRPKVSFSAYKRSARVISSTRYSVLDRVDFHAKCAKPDITWQARLSCLRRTGIPISHQMQLEQAYLSMITRGEVLVLPRILREWLIRPDGHIFGDPTDWVRTQ